MVHSKGRGYQKYTQNLDFENRSLKDLFFEIIKQAVDFLNFLYEQTKQKNFVKKNINKMLS